MTARRLRLLKRKPAKPSSSHAADRDSAEAVVVALPRPVPPPLSVPVSADAATPIFDSVMNDKWWTTTDEHPLESQFAMAFALDELTDEDRAKCAERARGSAIVGLA